MKINGLDVLEGVGTPRNTIPGLSIRNIGLLMARKRGVEGKVYSIDNSADDVICFGGPQSTSLGYWIVQSIFDNIGSAASVSMKSVRVVAPDAVAATFTGAFGSATLTATAAYQGSTDKGVWGNSISVSVSSKGAYTKDLYTAKVYEDTIERGANFRRLRETWEAKTVAELVNIFTAQSKYVKLTIDEEPDTLLYVVGTGTISITTGSSTVTGVGTSFSAFAANNRGTVLRTSTGVIIGKVLKVLSSTSVLLESPYTGNALAGVTFRTDGYQETMYDLAAGSDGRALTEEDFYASTDPQIKNGLSAFEEEDIQFLATTEFRSKTLSVELQNFVTSKFANLVTVIDCYPFMASEATIADYAETFLTPDVSPMAFYREWIEVQGETKDTTVIIPLWGALFGAYLRKAQSEGNYPHIAPGGEKTRLNGVIRVYPDKAPDGDRFLKEYNVNKLVFDKDLGYWMSTSRTQSTNDLHVSIHTRVSTSYISRSVKISERVLIQDSNSPEAQSQHKIRLRSFFKTLYNTGTLERGIPFSTAYIDPVITTGANRRQFISTLNYILSECVEYAQININRNDNLLTVSEGQ